MAATRPEDFPEPPAVPRGALHVVGAALVDDGKCLAAQRAETMDEPLKWEFPGGKVEAGESPSSALRREIAEELGLEIVVDRWLARGHGLSRGRELVLDVYLARPVGGELVLREHRDCGWFGLSEIPTLDWALADVPALAPLTDVLA